MKHTKKENVVGIEFVSSEFGIYVSKLHVSFKLIPPLSTLIKVFKFCH